MSHMKMPDHETREVLTRIALDIFTDCTNVGVPFQDSLLAIYISGLQHGVAGVQDIETELTKLQKQLNPTFKVVL
jgi:hypothetical protein